MSKSSSNVRHHYIPQCYLKNFTNDNKGVWVYNKDLSRFYQTSIDKICYIDNLYSITNTDFINSSKGIINRLSIETDYFANNIEKEYGLILKGIISKINRAVQSNQLPNVRITSEEKNAIAKHISIQFLRHPKMQQYDINHVNSLKGFVKSLLADAGVYENEVNKGIKESIEREEDPAICQYYCGMGEEDLIQYFIAALSRNYWILHISTGNFFYTSDFPITVEAYVKDVKKECLGLAQYGGVLTFPLSKNLLLKIWDYRYFEEKEKDDGCCEVANDKFIRQENIRQYLYANRLVISSQKEFSIIEFLVKSHGKELFIGVL